MTKKEKELLEINELLATAKITRNASYYKNRMVPAFLRNMPTYKKIEKATGVPAIFVGLLHFRESSRDAMSGKFKAYLGNGEMIIGTGKKSTIVPRKRGPFKTFVEGAIDALKYDKVHKVEDWTIESMIYFAERYNGLGYKRRGKRSPYIWGFANHGKGTGKYVRDGVYDPKAKTNNAGLWVYYKLITDAKPSLKTKSHFKKGKTVVKPKPVKKNLDYRSILSFSLLNKASSKVFQEALNEAGAKPKLKVDGDFGKKSTIAFIDFQFKHGLQLTDSFDEALELLKMEINLSHKAKKAVKPAKKEKVSTSKKKAPFRILDVAVKEIGQREIPGKKENPRIWVYQAYSTKSNKKGWSEDIAWCSTFACFVYEKSGLTSTNSPSARSWERAKYLLVTNNALPGDVVVFYRKGLSSGYGHVGVYLGEDKNYYYVLGGNQGNAVSVRRYSKKKTAGKSGKGPIGVFRVHSDRLTPTEVITLKKKAQKIIDKHYSGTGGKVT